MNTTLQATFPEPLVWACEVIPGVYRCQALSPPRHWQGVAPHGSPPPQKQPLLTVGHIPFQTFLPHQINKYE